LPPGRLPGGGPMMEALYRRYSSRYIAVVFLMTRLIGSVGGALVIYYVLFTTRLPDDVRQHFIGAGYVLVPLAVGATFPLAMWNTRTLRRVLRQLSKGHPLHPGEASQALLEAVAFPRRQNTGEALLVPMLSVVPMCIYLWWTCDPRPIIYVQISIATALAIAGVLLITFFASERWMQVVVRDLCHHGIPADFHSLPASRLQTRMVVCFGLISMLTSVMIAALANQRALDIIESPGSRHDAVASLRLHTLYITVTSLVMGFLYSRMLANSVASRANRLVMLMKRVQAGDLSQRAQPTGNDEIDILARQFNRMVEELQLKDRTVRDLNVNLERKVRSRTEELALSQMSLQVSLEKLRESDRHKTEFFSNVSHELRTPLMMILSPLDQIQKRNDAGLSEKARSLINVASMNAGRLLKLINQLLDFSKLEAGHLTLRKERVEIGTIIERLVEAAAPLAEHRGLSLSADIQPGLPATAADEEKLDTIVTNLVSNAIKFTPRGGSVVVRASLDGTAAEQSLRVAVIDSGIGIAPENLGRLFQRFSQIDGSTSREFAGTGLGLALAKELVELHGGTIRVDSQPGRGSCFWFTLPVDDSVPQAPQEPDDAPVLRAERFADLTSCDAPLAYVPQQSAGSHKVLVVDDTPEVRHLVGEILSEQYQVVFATDGEMGWQMVQEESPDLIISDVMMPKVDGYELCGRVKADPQTAAIPFVLLTARAQVSMKIEGLNCGADDYLVKPFHAEELLARARALLRLRDMHNDLAAKHARLQDTVAELKQTQNQLVQSEKMSSLGQLTAGLAHEINNAINAVYNGIPAISDRLDRLQNIVESALEDGPAPLDEERSNMTAAFQSLRKLAGVVSEGADRTARIVRDMKTFSHPGTESPEPTDIGAVLALCVGLLQNQYRERAVVHCDIQRESWCLAPAGHLNQVFLNLLTNAVQAMPQGGEIFAAVHRDYGMIRATIRDTGPGIPAHVLPRIFDPFFTTKAPGEGTGLGLSVSYGIVTRLGGTIECHSLEGVGTEFIVRLPALTDGPPSQALSAGARRLPHDPD
jgi:signal transduction histidine kinase